MTNEQEERNKFIRGVNRETAIVLYSFMGVMITGAIATFVLSGVQEIGAADYRHVKKLVKTAPVVDELVVEYFEDDKITHYEYTKIVHASNEYWRKQAKKGLGQ